MALGVRLINEKIEVTIRFNARRISKVVRARGQALGLYRIRAVSIFYKAHGPPIFPVTFKRVARY